MSNEQTQLSAYRQFEQWWDELSENSDGLTIENLVAMTYNDGSAVELVSDVDNNLVDETWSLMAATAILYCKHKEGLFRNEPL